MHCVVSENIHNSLLQFGKSFIFLFFIPLLIFIELLFTEELIDYIVPEHVYTNPKENHGKL